MLFGYAFSFLGKKSVQICSVFKLSCLSYLVLRVIYVCQIQVVFLVRVSSHPRTPITRANLLDVSQIHLFSVFFPFIPLVSFCVVSITLVILKFTHLFPVVPNLPVIPFSAIFISDIAIFISRNLIFFVVISILFPYTPMLSSTFWNIGRIFKIVVLNALVC